MEKITVPIPLIKTEDYTERPGDALEVLYNLCEDLRNKELVKPYFQRDYVWENTGVDKATGWIETVLSQEAIGVVVTYQLKSGGSKFIADGLQRLTATLRFIGNPKYYGFDMSEDEAIACCRKFKLPVQHRLYQTHEDAMAAFQKINKGTALTPGEFFKGELCGTDNGQFLFDTLPSLIFKYEDSFSNKRKTPREQKHVLMRDALAQFLQYSSGTKIMRFWDVSTTKIREDRKVIERELAIYIADKSRSELERQISDFERFVASHAEVLREQLDKAGLRGKRMSRTVNRWLLHVRIWQKNSKIPVSDYVDFLAKFLTLFKEKGHSSISSRFEFIHCETGELVSATVHTSQMGQMVRISKGLGADLHNYRTRKSSDAAIGYDRSHKQPFSEHGDGETFLEPSSLNRARGKKPVEEQASLSLQ